MSGPERREAVFDPVFLDDLAYWTRTDRKRALRTLQLVEVVPGQTNEELACGLDALSRALGPGADPRLRKRIARQ